MVIEVEMFESSDLRPLIFLWGCMNSEDQKRKLDTRNELFARIMDAAVS